MLVSLHAMSKPEAEDQISEKVEALITYLKQKKWAFKILFLFNAHSMSTLSFFSRLHSSYDVARRTVLLMREICAKTRWANAM